MRIRFFISLLLFLVACSGKEKNYEERLIRNAVRKYNSALIETYRDFVVSRLDEYATESEVKRIDVLILSMRIEGKFLNAKIKGLRFKEVRMTGDDTAEVDTEEDWEYQHLNIKTHQPMSELKKVKYNMTYTLVRRDNRWLVKFVDYTESKGKRRDLLEEYQQFLREREKK